MRAIILLVQLWALVETTRAYSKGPRLYMCETFYVDHENSVNGTGENVKLILRKVTSPGNDSEEVSCYMPSQEYTVEVKSSGQNIGGFLLQANKGRFPFDTRTWSFPETASGSPLIVSGPCPRSVSHKELLKNEDHTPQLKFGYKSPKGSQSLTFRLSVVFDSRHHLENVNISFPSCLHTPPPPYTTTPPTMITATPDRNVTTATPDVNATTTPDINTTTPDMNATNSCNIATTAAPTTIPESERTPADSTCLQERTIIFENKTMTVVENNITYNCASYTVIRTVACGEDCTTKDGAAVCCEPSHTSRRKKFKCTACSNVPAGSEHLQEMDMFFQVLVPSSRCSCYLCPAP